MNKKAQTGIVSFLIIFLFGILVYVVLSSYIGTSSTIAMETIELTGTEAFFLSNIHLFVIIGFLIVTIGYGAFYVFGRSQ